MSAHIIESFIAGDTLTAQRGVSIVGTGNTVVYPTNTATAPLGISKDYADSGSSIPVEVNGVAKLYFNDTVTAGAVVALDGSGRGVPFSAATAAAWYLGILVGASVAATGTVAEVLIMPGQASSE